MLRTRLHLRFAILVSGCALGAAAFGQSRGTGLSTDCSAYAAVPLPAEAEQAPAPKAAPACASYRSYRGLGRPQNYAEARACAWQERLAQKADLGQNPKEPIAWVVGGSLILADIYFNGAGVQRNIPLAMRLACEAEENMVQVAVPEIEKRDASSGPHAPLEFCDYAASTFTMNFCTAYSSAIEDDRKNRYFNSLKPSMTAEQRSAFEKLLSAEDAFIEAHAGEVYQGGTIRNMRTAASQGILKDLFRTTLVHCERKQWPALSEQQIAAADSQLDREYENRLQQSGKRTKADIEDGAVTADDLARAERAWQAYRDAWVAFARLRYPSAVRIIRAEVTIDRYRYLKTIR